MIFGSIIRASPAERAAIFTLCFAAGVASGIPLYTTFWWWDLFAHGLAGVAITSAAVAAGQSRRRSLGVTIALAIGWELVEPHLSALTPLTFLVGDWPSDIAATVAGGLLVVAWYSIIETHD